MERASWEWFGDVGHPETWEWFGDNGHLIVGEDCRFHLCTLVGAYLVSTVGKWLPEEGTRDIHANVRGIKLVGRGDARRADFMQKCGYQQIGAGRTFETMVFLVGVEPNRCTAASNPDCACGLPQPLDWGGVDSDGYNVAGDATRGHMAMCEKWSRIDPDLYELAVKESDDVAR